MEFEFSDGRIRFSKELSDLDEFVIDLIKIIDQSGIKYSVISGYLAILFGRPRVTEDVDVFIEDIDYPRFKKFFDTLIERGYEFINSPDPEDLYHNYLKESLAIRAVKAGSVFPNMEIKLAKSKLDKTSLEKRIAIEFSGNRIWTSCLELQIAFKLYLGSRKDIEDARFLFKLFEGKLDSAEIERYAIELGCRGKLRFLGDEYGKRKNV
ncbi:MAG: hypothetical protein HYT72_01340 [Candidatus Aenigmarchaeota archaeon]|nr:hypothetical protein [Candidatus Aenigmarchaeota archaeon]